MENSVVVVEDMTPMSPAAVMDQVKAIQQVMSVSMKDGEHYGTIPGCGDKKVLLKSGAEKLNLMFRLAPKYDIVVKDRPNGHREYEITCNIYHAPSNTFLGSGVGACSTMESKWRYRTGPVERTKKPVPKEYWTVRESNPGKAKELLGGDGYSTKKYAGKWEIVIQGEKVEHDNPADYYNTCLKMGKKRAHVDGVLTVTAASDIFEQDIDENPEMYGRGAEEQEPSKSSSVQQKDERPTAEDSKRKATLNEQKAELLDKEEKGPNAASDAQLKAVNGMMKGLGLKGEEEKLEWLTFNLEICVESISNLTKEQASRVIKCINEKK